MPLFTRHPLVLQTAYSDLKRRALEQPFLLTGTPGSVSVREVSSRSFFYRQFYDAQGKKKAEYIGAAGEPPVEERAEAMPAAIALTQELVDLLVASSGSEVTTRAVPELGAHAQAMPYLRPLLARPIEAIVLGREGVVPTRVPRAEAFAWHKVLLSQIRGATSDKRGKDRAQAAVMLAVLAEDAPDAVKGVV